MQVLKAGIRIFNLLPGKMNFYAVDMKGFGLNDICHSCEKEDKKGKHDDFYAHYKRTK